MYHFQTFVLGIFPFRLHGAPGPVGDAPAWTTRSSPTTARSPRARSAACPTSGAASSSTAVAAHPVMEAIYSPSGARHTRDDARRRRCATGWPRSRCRARTSRRHEPHRPRPAGEGRVRVRRPGASPTTPHRHELVVLRPLGAAPRGGHARGRRRVHVLGDVAADSASDAPPARRRPDADVAPHHGDGPHGRRPAHERVSTAWQRLHDVDNVVVHRLVGVPDVHRLRPDAHDRGAGHPRRRARWPASTRCGQPARPAPERRPPIVRFGTYCVFQCPPWQEPARVVQEELAARRARRGDGLRRRVGARAALQPLLPRGRRTAARGKHRGAHEACPHRHRRREPHVHAPAALRGAGRVARPRLGWAGRGRRRPGLPVPAVRRVRRPDRRDARHLRRGARRRAQGVGRRRVTVRRAVLPAAAGADLAAADPPPGPDPPARDQQPGEHAELDRARAAGADGATARPVRRPGRGGRALPVRDRGGRPRPGALPRRAQRC